MASRTPDESIIGGGVSIRGMRLTDLPRCAELNQCVGWNQLVQDWQRFLALEPEGCFVAEHDGRVIGTVTTVNYQNRFGWVGMVIVDPAMRRRGIGGALLERGIDYLKGIGVETVKLDATPQGKLLYDTMGFVDEYGAARWHGIAPQVTPDVQPEAMTTEDIRGVVALDEPVFGADRTQVIALYLKHYLDRCMVMHNDGQIVGYLCGRRGRDAEHIGPWVAQNRGVAETLLLTRLANCAGKRVFVDTLEPCPDSTEILRNLGFEIQRPFIRMYLGPNHYPGQPEYVYGLSGPELG
jgi:N-acetylglutamate synthase-like GNAT family acetyltransferase